MPDLFTSILRPVVKWFRSVSGAKSERPISPEEFLAAFKAMMNDPEQARICRRALMGTIVPIQGAMACTISPGDIASGSFSCGNYSFTNGNVGIGAGITSPGAPLEVGETSQITSGSTGAILAKETANPTADSAAGYAAATVVGSTQSGNPFNFTGKLYGVSPQVVHQGTGQLDNAWADGIWVQKASTGKIVNARGIDIQGANSNASAAIDNYSSIYVHQPGNTGAITNNYGIFIESQTTGINNYAIYSAGGNNYFGGNVGIGTTTPAYLLDVNGIPRVAGSRMYFTNAGESNQYINLEWGTPRSGGTKSWNFRMSEAPGSTTYWDAIRLDRTADASGCVSLVPWTGNVGIGLGSNAFPGARLHVSGGSILSEVTGDVRNVVLNQLSGSVMRTAISFKQQNTEHWVMGLGMTGALNRTDFFIADGAGVERFILLKPRGSGLDDSDQINAAIVTLAGQNPPGGIIQLSQGNYRLNSGLTMVTGGVKLRGCGGTWPDGQDNSVTSLQWYGSSGGTMISIVSPFSAEQIEDLEVSDLALDGRDIAGTGLLIDQVISSKFRSVHVRHMLSSGGIGFKLTTSATSADFGTSWNLFENCSANYVDYGVVLDGNASDNANTYHNTFVGMSVGCRGASSDIGVWLKKCDNNSFYRTWISNDNGYGVVVEDPIKANSNYFFHLQAGGGFNIASTPSPSSIPGKNFVFGYDRGNGQPTPTPAGSAASYLAWIESHGSSADMYGITVH